VVLSRLRGAQARLHAVRRLTAPDIRRASPRNLPGRAATAADSSCKRKCASGAGRFSTQLAVHAFGYRGRLPRLHAGSKISFRRAGKAISAVKASGQKSWSVAFLGRVVKSSKHGLVLRLADGKKVTFSAKQVRHSRTKSAKRQKHAARSASVRAGAANVTINIQGLQPGVMVLITETVEGRNVTITISFPGKSDPVAGGEQSSSGTVTDVADDAFVLTTDDGSVTAPIRAATRTSSGRSPRCPAMDSRSRPRTRAR
jgi:hypothetical protein